MRHISPAILGAWIAIYSGMFGGFIAIFSGLAAARRKGAQGSDQKPVRPGFHRRRHHAR